MLEALWQTFEPFIRNSSTPNNKIECEKPSCHCSLPIEVQSDAMESYKAPKTLR